MKRLQANRVIGLYYAIWCHAIWCDFVKYVVDDDNIDIGILSVRPSVCHAPVLYRNGLTCRHTFFSIMVAPSY